MEGPAFCLFCKHPVVGDRCCNCGTVYPCSPSLSFKGARQNKPDQFDEMNEEQWQSFLEEGGHLIGENYSF